MVECWDCCRVRRSPVITCGPKLFCTRPPAGFLHPFYAFKHEDRSDAGRRTGCRYASRVCRMCWTRLRRRVPCFTADAHRRVRITIAVTCVTLHATTVVLLVAPGGSYAQDFCVDTIGDLIVEDYAVLASLLNATGLYGTHRDFVPAMLTHAFSTAHLFVRAQTPSTPASRCLLQPTPHVRLPIIRRFLDMSTHASAVLNTLTALNINPVVLTSAPALPALTYDVSACVLSFHSFHTDRS